MPIYEFECSNCGYRIEKFYPVIPKNQPDYIFEICGAEKDDTMTGVIRKFRRVMSSSNFALKGTCWAKDGYTMQHQGGSRVVAVQGPDHPENPINPNRKG